MEASLWLSRYLVIDDTWQNVFHCNLSICVSHNLLVDAIVDQQLSNESG